MKYKIIILVLLLCVSCKTKLKIIERTKEVREVITSVNEIKVTDKVVDSFTDVISETFIIKENETLELTQADPKKVITIINSDGKTLTIKGANAVIKKSKEVIKERDSISIKVTKTDNSKLITETNTKEKSKTTSRNTDTKITGISTWLWIGLIIALILGAVYLVLKYRPKLFI